MAKTCPICNTTYDDTSAFCPADGSTLIATENSGDLVGSVIADRYLVSALLGEGGMGRVYLARHVRLPQQAAIKVLHPGMLSDPDAVARFNREAANAARIEHDRVARVFDFGETRDGSVYLAMEYVPGRTLRAILEEEHRLPMARAANLTYQVAEGLDAAHRIQIVHRDLKPDNIMVVTDDQGVDRAKVVDFGIAKAGDGGGQTKLTRTGTVVGTPEYMSPEQVLGEAIDARSDVYALALVSYHMFTGTLPFTGSTPERMFTARLIEDPRPLAVAAPDVEWPAELQAAFDRALDKDPATRTATALEFGDAVVAAVESWSGAPVLRSRTPISSRVTTPPAGSTTAGAGASGSGTMARDVAAITAPPSPAPPPSPATPAAARANRTPLFVGAGLVVAAAIGWFVLKGGAPSAGSEVATPPVAPESSSVAANLPAAPPPAADPAGRRAVPDAARRETTSVASSLPVTPPLQAPTPETATAEASTSPAARQELEAIQTLLEAADSGPDEARAAIPRLTGLLGRLGTAADSFHAYIALVSAHGQAGEPLRACNALRNARGKARSAQERRLVQDLFANEALSTCVP